MPAPAPAGNNSNNAASPAGNNGSDGSQPAVGSYARPLPAMDEVDVQISPNTEMRATLDTPLSTRTSKSGDRFSATLVDPVRGANGSVALPAGTRVEGEVADSEAGKVKPTGAPSAISALKGKGKLSVRFRDAILPNGQTVILNTSLVSVNRTGANAIKTDVKTVSRPTSGYSYNSAFGGPLPGFAIGALPGGGYILAMRSKDVDLPAQTGMVIRFDQPINGVGSTPQQ